MPPVVLEHAASGFHHHRPPRRPVAGNADLASGRPGSIPHRRVAPTISASRMRESGTSPCTSRLVVVIPNTVRAGRKPEAEIAASQRYSADPTRRHAPRKVGYPYGMAGVRWRHPGAGVHTADLAHDLRAHWPTRHGVPRMRALPGCRAERCSARAPPPRAVDWGGRSSPVTGGPRQGNLFVGLGRAPAGRRAGRKPGINREQVYVTNAVKHFRSPAPPEAQAPHPQDPEPHRGRRPADGGCSPSSASSIRSRCGTGATAAKAMLGNDFRLTAHRGEVLHPPATTFDRDFDIVATPHPSAAAARAGRAAGSRILRPGHRPAHRGRIARAPALMAVRIAHRAGPTTIGAGVLYPPGLAKARRLGCSSTAGVRHRGTSMPAYLATLAQADDVARAVAATAARRLHHVGCEGRLQGLTRSGAG